eukprot:364245-Chlamydomonas_euryale.AAC.4
MASAEESDADAEPPAGSRSSSRGDGGGSGSAARASAPVACGALVSELLLQQRRVALESSLSGGGGGGDAAACGAGVFAERRGGVRGGGRGVSYRDQGPTEIGRLPRSGSYRNQGSAGP